MKTPMFHTAKRGGARAARAIHTVPKLANVEKYTEQGIEGLYTPGGFREAWLEYQQYLTAKLTVNTAGTRNETKTPYHILLNTAKQPLSQHVFHYASQAHNNHFFFQQLGDKSEVAATKPSRFIMERLADENIGSVSQFRDEMLHMAAKTFGQGWLFLVELPDKKMKLMRCNNDGTPYYYGKNQLLDMNGLISEDAVLQLDAMKNRQDRLDFTLPILALNLWDPAYLHDYGVTGRSEYLENAWNCINWDVVNKRLFQA